MNDSNSHGHDDTGTASGDTAADEIMRPARRMSAKALQIGLVAITGALALLASVQVWVQIGFVPGVSTVEHIEVSGQKVSPALTLISLATLATALVLTIAGPAFRKVLGILLAVLGGALVALGVTAAASPLDGARGQIEIVTGISGDAQSGLVAAQQVSPWPVVTAVIGVLILLTGLSIVVFSGRWKSAGRKYEGSSAAARSKARADGETDRISDWESLSDGDDPTDLP